MLLQAPMAAQLYLSLGETTDHFEPDKLIIES